MDNPNAPGFISTFHQRYLDIMQQKSSRPEKPEIMFTTEYGTAYWADSVVLLREVIPNETIDLIVTSPPFGLVEKRNTVTLTLTNM